MDSKRLIGPPRKLTSYRVPPVEERPKVDRSLEVRMLLKRAHQAFLDHRDGLLLGGGVPDPLPSEPPGGKVA
jgi:hypothetical protein